MTAGRSIVFDSWAALALLRDEQPAADVVRRHLKRAATGNVRLLMNVINLGEVYYRMCRLIGENKATERLRQVRNLPISFVQARESLVIEAARLKGRHPVSYADAFAVATAKAEDSAVLTGDPEILALPASVVRVIRLDRHAR